MELEYIFLTQAFVSLLKGILLQFPTLWSFIRFFLEFLLHTGEYFALKFLTCFHLITQDLDPTFSTTREYKFLAVSRGILMELDHIQTKQNRDNRDIFIVSVIKILMGEYKSKTEEEKISVQRGIYTREIDLPSVLYLCL